MLHIDVSAINAGGSSISIDKDCFAHFSIYPVSNSKLIQYLVSLASLYDIAIFDKKSFLEYHQTAS